MLNLAELFWMFWVGIIVLIGVLIRKPIEGVDSLFIILFLIVFTYLPQLFGSWFDRWFNRVFDKKYND